MPILLSDRSGLRANEQPIRNRRFLREAGVTDASSAQRGSYQFVTPMAHMRLTGPCSTHREAAKSLNLLRKIGAPDTIRTCDLCLRRATLYPAELRVLAVAIP